jgi:AcrR family transcriptional regulator
MKSLRLLSLLDHLRSARRPVSAEALAQRLGVSIRTIYRDIASLQGIDRQHPRDLFDVRGLLAHEGLSADLREAFIVYLLSHSRPMGEVLSGRVKDLANEYRNGFEGMTEEVVAIEELIKTQHEMIEALIGSMPDHHREFLIGFERGEPDWSLLKIDGLAGLPAIRWRQRNLDKLKPEQRSALVELLQSSLQRRA